MTSCGLGRKLADGIAVLRRKGARRFSRSGRGPPATPLELTGSLIENKAATLMMRVDGESIVNAAFWTATFPWCADTLRSQRHQEQRGRRHGDRLRTSLGHWHRQHGLSETVQESHAMDLARTVFASGRRVRRRDPNPVRRFREAGKCRTLARSTGHQVSEDIVGNNTICSRRWCFTIGRRICRNCTNSWGV